MTLCVTLITHPTLPSGRPRPRALVANYLRDERVMKTQRKQMNARSLLNDAF